MEKKLIIKIATFLVGGGLGMLAYFIILYALTEFLFVLYAISAAIASIANILINFFIQKFWVFDRGNSSKTSKELIQYLLMGLVLTVLNSILLYVFVELSGIHYLLVQAILSAFFAFVSFFVIKKIFS